MVAEILSGAELSQNGHKMVWLEGVFEDDVYMHYLKPYNAKNGGPLRTHCHRVASFSAGHALLDVRHAIKFATICEVCAIREVDSGED